MATENPKVSAYVPQILKDRLTKFREEREGISESQAVTVILAEYFNIEQVLDRIPEGAVVGGVTLGRVEALENQVVELRLLVDELCLKSLEKSSTNGKLPTVLPTDSVEENLVLLTDTEGSQENEEKVKHLTLPADPFSGLPLPQDEKLDELLDDPKIKVVVAGAEAFLSELNSNPPSKPLSKDIQLSGKPLPLRLGITEGGLSGSKNKLLSEEFKQWTQKKDPDGIAWIPSQKGKGYEPVGELSGELLNKLLE